MTSIAHDAPILIAGGGLVGSALALALAQAGIRSIVVEPLPREKQLEARFDGRVSAIALTSQRILQKLGVWDGLEAEPITDIRVLDGNAPMFVHFAYREVGDEPFGFMVANLALRQALFRAIGDNARITLISGAHVENFLADAGGVTATLSNGETRRSALFIAADGRHSTLRAKAGLGARVLEYGQTAMVATLAHANPHRGLALERFLPPGPFAMLPMRDEAGKHRSCVVWTEKNAMAKHYLSLPHATLEAELAKRAGEYYGAITLLAPPHAYPLTLVHADRLAADRFALIGDAAHGIHPIAGQGVNLGYRDVAVFAELLTQQHALGLDLGAPDLLARYNDARRGDSWSMTAFTDVLDRLFSNNIPGIRTARKLGLAAVQRVPRLKHRLMRQAMGLGQDLPPLMQKSI
jgi:2-octaprenyl-6-methoxyphenol hydroxylase